MIAEWESNGRELPQDPAQITVSELLDRYWTFAQSYYKRQDGSPTDELNYVRLSLRPVNELYGSRCAVDFGPVALRAVRETMIESGLTRGGINSRVARIKAAFKWAASHELIPIGTHQALTTVEGLRRGRSEARESAPVVPVPEADIDAIMPHVSRQVWALVQLQLLTGARAGELLPLRALDLDTSGAVWVFKPDDHKTAHHGHGRTLFIGPKGQAVLAPFLVGRAVDVPLFSPREAEAERRAVLTQMRRTPKSCGNVVGSNRKRRPIVEPGDTYTVRSYRRAIHRGCDKAKIARWSPHRLRHNAATRLRRDFGIELAQTILGHRLGSAITEVYAEANISKAVAVMAKVG